jgi:hypothetical protein
MTLAEHTEYVASVGEGDCEEASPLGCGECLFAVPCRAYDRKARAEMARAYLASYGKSEGKPVGQYGFFWDNNSADPVVGKLTANNNSGFEIDDFSCWEHFLPFTPEELARFRKRGLFPKT